MPVSGPPTIAPSLLAADFARLGTELEDVMAADNGVQAHITCIDVAAREGLGEAVWKVRRAGGGAGTCRGG